MLRCRPLGHGRFGTVGRVRRWLKRIAVALAALVISLTIASFAYNAATDGDVKAATALYHGPLVRVRGTLVAYRRWGHAGTPIVLLGGFVEPTYVWRRVGALLGRDHRVFALDLPPFGYTERKGPYTLRSWVDLVRAFEARFGLRRPVVVGHSLGAAVAVGVGMRDARDTAGVVLLDGDALASNGAPSWIGDVLLDPWFTSIYRIVTTSDWVFRRGLAAAYGHRHPPLTRAVLAEWERPFKVRGTAAAFRAMARYGIQGFRLADLHRLRVRTAVVWGRDDTVDALSAGRRSARALHAPLRVLPHAGHLSMLAAPRALAAALEAFAR
jgi:pimeloyl-ACP methyl ester carboxylesterase